MAIDSERLEYWKKRMMEAEILELKEEIAELERTVELLDDSEDSVEAVEEEE